MTTKRTPKAGRKKAAPKRQRGVLTDKQEMFCQHYTATHNATEAAKLAGYSARTAGAVGHENLRKPEIEARIRELERPVLEQAGVNREVLLRELAGTILADITEVVRFGTEEVRMTGDGGQPVVLRSSFSAFRDFEEIRAKGLGRHIQSIRIDRNGNAAPVMHDRVRAMALAAQILGLTQTEDDSIPVAKIVKETEEALEILRERKPGSA